MATHSVFLPGESQRQRSLVSCCLWGCTESDTTEATQQQQHAFQIFVQLGVTIPKVILLRKNTPVQNLCYLIGNTQLSKPCLLLRDATLSAGFLRYYHKDQVIKAMHCRFPNFQYLFLSWSEKKLAKLFTQKYITQSSNCLGLTIENSDTYSVLTIENSDGKESACNA